MCQETKTCAKSYWIDSVQAATVPQAASISNGLRLNPLEAFSTANMPLDLRVLHDRLHCSFLLAPGGKGALDRCRRAHVSRALVRRHCLTDHFLSLLQRMHSGPIETVPSLTRKGDVELAVVPAWRYDSTFLMSDNFARMVDATVS